MILLKSTRKLFVLPYLHENTVLKSENDRSFCRFYGVFQSIQVFFIRGSYVHIPCHQCNRNALFIVTTRKTQGHIPWNVIFINILLFCSLKLCGGLHHTMNKEEGVVFRISSFIKLKKKHYLCHWVLFTFIISEHWRKPLYSNVEFSDAIASLDLGYERERVKASKTSTLGTWRPIVFNVLRCMNNE